MYVLIVLIGFPPCSPLRAILCIPSNLLLVRQCVYVIFLLFHTFSFAYFSICLVFYWYIFLVLTAYCYTNSIYFNYIMIRVLLCIHFRIRLYIAYSQAVFTVVRRKQSALELALS